MRSPVDSGAATLTRRAAWSAAANTEPCRLMHELELPGFRGPARAGRGSLGRVCRGTRKPKRKFCGSGRARRAAARILKCQLTKHSHRIGKALGGQEYWHPSQWLISAFPDVYIVPLTIIIELLGNTDELIGSLPELNSCKACKDSTHPLRSLYLI